MSKLNQVVLTIAIQKATAAYVSGMEGLRVKSSVLIDQYYAAGVRSSMLGSLTKDSPDWLRTLNSDIRAAIVAGFSKEERTVLAFKKGEVPATLKEQRKKAQQKIGPYMSLIKNGLTALEQAETGRAPAVDSWEIKVATRIANLLKQVKAKEANKKEPASIPLAAVINSLDAALTGMVGKKPKAKKPAK